MIPADLFQFAYIPSWYEQLYELSQLAAPEPWRFRQPSYETQKRPSSNDTSIRSFASKPLTTAAPLLGRLARFSTSIKNSPAFIPG